MYAQRTEFRYENIFAKAGNIKNYKNLRTICFGHQYNTFSFPLLAGFHSVHWQRTILSGIILLSDIQVRSAYCTQVSPCLLSYTNLSQICYIFGTLYLNYYFRGEEISLLAKIIIIIVKSKRMVIIKKPRGHNSPRLLNQNTHFRRGSLPSECLSKNDRTLKYL